MEDDQRPAEQVVSDALDSRRTAISAYHKQKAEVFADNLERQWSANHLDHIGRSNRRVRTSLRNRDDRELQAASPEKVRKCIKVAKVRKALGRDGISILKALPNQVVAALIGIINTMLRLRHFPSPWKCADMILLPDPHDRGTRHGRFQQAAVDSWTCRRLSTRSGTRNFYTRWWKRTYVPSVLVQAVSLSRMLNGSR